MIAVAVIDRIAASINARNPKLRFFNWVRCIRWHACAAGWMLNLPMNPVAANIIHHAVEMFLKAGLCGHTTEAERRKLGHDLTKIWQAFKSHYDPEAKLARFDACVQGLHEFEDIRYPEGMMKPDAIVIRMQFANAPMPKGPVMPTGKTQPKEFSLETSEIDTLVRAVCEAASIAIMNHLIATYREPGKTYLKQENAEAEHLFK